jgi:hypothetical protein
LDAIFKENVVQYFSPNWDIGFLEVCKWLMYCYTGLHTDDLQ